MANKEIFFRDLPLDISITSTGDISTVDNEESIKQSLQMIIETAKGSRVFLSNYGCRIRGFLFEPFDISTAKRIGEELRESITNYEKRIVILDINVIMNQQYNSYEVELTYQIINASKPETVLFSIERL